MRVRRFPYLAEAAAADAGTGGGSGAPPAAESPPVAVESVPPAVAASPATEPGPTESASDLVNWRQIVPAEYREHSAVTKYTSFADFMKGAVNAQDLIGRSVQLPKQYDPAKGLANEGMVDVFKKLGVPETPEDYSIAKPEGENPLWDAELERKFRLEAHKHQLLPWQVQPLVDLYNSHMEAMGRQLEAERAAAVHKGEVELGRMHGADTENVRKLASVLYEMMGQGVFGGEEIGKHLVTKMQDSGLLADPLWITGMANLAKSLQEADYLISETHPSGVQTVGDVDAQIQKLVEKGRDITPQEDKLLDQLYEQKARYLAARR